MNIQISIIVIVEIHDITFLYDIRRNHHYKMIVRCIRYDNRYPLVRHEKDQLGIYMIGRRGTDNPYKYFIPAHTHM